MSAPKMLYIAGVPGAGKTTLMGKLLDPAGEVHWHVENTAPFAHTVHGWNRMPTNIMIHEIGAKRDGFGGTDALGMSVQPKVVQFLAETRPDRVVAEGDRLGNGKFFRAVLELGYELGIVILELEDGVAAQRRKRRAEMLGTKLQNETWLKGRTTKVQGLANEFLEHVRLMQGTLTPEMLARILRETEPVFRGI